MLTVVPDLSASLPADGAPGFWKAAREVFPQARTQRCWFHYADLGIMPTWRL